MVQSMETELTVISPYFVPGEQVTTSWVESAKGGKRVRVLTNSLIANDVAAVHGGYERYRKTLVEGGVQVWELKPMAGSNVQSSLFGSSGASLHTKALAVDGRALFVGSYNLDPRSTWLNCEQGDGREPGARAPARGDLRRTDRATACLAGDACRRRAPVERRHREL